VNTQLTFDWPTGIALGADDFFVSDANAQAYAMVQSPATWPDRKLVLVGPHGCGKTHLAKVAATSLNASLHSAKALPELSQAGAAIVIEDMHHLPDTAQEHMFHLHNHLRHTGGTLLMTATTPPTRWHIGLADLASRMQATAIATIDAPDDALLQALIMKLFADRQIAPQPQLIPYLARRIERSYGAVEAIVDLLDRTAMQHGRPLTRALAASLLDNPDHDG
jgi:chromosomal replication initiation ATPase DnaA